MQNKLNLKWLLVLISAGMLICCNYQLHYAKQDYSFFDQQFSLPSAGLLRTDGVYVLEKKIYKFYPTGQVNLIIDLDHKLHHPEDYVEAFNQSVRRAEERQLATLFEGYYRVKGNRIVLQQWMNPRKQFYYTYASLGENKLGVVTSTHLGKGKFEEKYFGNESKTYYEFVPTQGQYLAPNW